MLVPRLLAAKWEVEGVYKFSLTKVSGLGHKRQTSPGSKQFVAWVYASTGTENAAPSYTIISYTDPQKSWKHVPKRVRCGVGGGVAAVPHSQFDCSSFRVQFKHHLYDKSFLNTILGPLPSGWEMFLSQGSRITSHTLHFLRQNKMYSLSLH